MRNPIITIWLDRHPSHSTCSCPPRLVRLLASSRDAEKQWELSTIDDIVLVIPEDGIDSSQIYQGQSKAKPGYLPESVVVDTMILSIAFDEEFDIRGFILDRNNRGLGSEIHDIPCGLVPSPSAF